MNACECAAYGHIMHIEMIISKNSDKKIIIFRLKTIN